MKYTKEMHEAYRAEQEEKAAKAEEARRERAEKDSARRAWLSDGGNTADFERAWPMLRDEGRRRRILDADKLAREAHRARGISRI